MMRPTDLHRAELSTERQSWYRAAVTKALSEPIKSGGRIHEMERARQALREWILSGELRPGEPISQVRIANRLGVSRGPLREALRLLEREGFIDQEHNHRARVAPFSFADWDQLSAMRISLESLAIALAVPLLHAADHARLDEILAGMAELAKGDDADAWEEQHREFHATLVRPAGQRFAVEYAHLSDHFERYRRVFAAQESTSFKGNRDGEHEAIAAAARAGDADHAAALMAQHLARNAVVAIGAIDPSFEPIAVRRALCVQVRSDSNSS